MDVAYIAVKGDCRGIAHGRGSVVGRMRCDHLGGHLSLFGVYAGGRASLKIHHRPSDECWGEGTADGSNVGGYGLAHRLAGRS